eukprot:SAG22_NODE_1589_length_4048_cov_68.361611_3_plen_103_part_00
MATDGGIHCALLIEKKTGKKITDPALTSLTELRLINNQITDLAPLAALTSLTQLYLNGNQITDLAPLSALTSLTQLWLNNNQIRLNCGSTTTRSPNSPRCPR